MSHYQCSLVLRVKMISVGFPGSRQPDNLGHGEVAGEKAESPLVGDRAATNRRPKGKSAWPGRYDRHQRAAELYRSPRGPTVLRSIRVVGTRKIFLRRPRRSMSFSKRSTAVTAIASVFCLIVVRR